VTHILPTMIVTTYRWCAWYDCFRSEKNLSCDV